MKLDSPPRFTSFYESFSDLIFATLIIFVLLVMVLILQLRAEIDSVIWPNRFTGAADETDFYMGFSPIDGEVHVMWLPSHQYRAFSYTRRFGGWDPLLQLCQTALDEPGLQHMPISELGQIGSAFSKPLLGGRVAVYSDFSSASHILIAERRNRPEAFANSTASELRRRLFGTNVEAPTPSDWVQTNVTLNSAGEWSLGQSGMAAFQENAFESSDPLIRFGVTSDRQIRLGEAIVPVQMFQAILRSISPGAGFYIEFLHESGEPAAPPEWVLADVLQPVGFDSRMVRDEAFARSDATNE